MLLIIGHQGITEASIYIFYWKLYGYTSLSFFCQVFKGDNFCDFLFALLEEEVFPKWGLLLQNKKLLPWEQILSFMR